MADLNLDLSGIKPLLGKLGLGEAPPPAPPVDQIPAPPMPPPPTPAQAGFTAYSADPRNQQTIANSLTMPGTPITPPNVPPASPLSGSPAPAPDAPALKPFNPMASIQPLTQPTAPAPPPTMAQDMAANPNQYQRQTFAPGRGVIGNGLTLLASGLAGAAGGLGNKNPMAGLDYVEGLKQADAAIPAANANAYNLRNIKPLQDAQALKQGAATLAHTEATTKILPEAQDLKQQAQDLKGQQLDATYAKLGFKKATDVNGVETYVPDPDSPVTKTRDIKDQLVQAQISSTGAQEELRKANAALASAKNDPTSPAFRQAQQRVNVAQQNAGTASQRLNLSTQQFMMHSRGTDTQGNALPGAMIDDNGNTIGTAFQQNVRPTGTERNKADMASSAAEQLSDIKSIMQKNRTMFGPGYGQTSAFKQWIGSQDPDAQRFMAARTIAADHLAGTFGGRSEAALTALDNAIGQFKDNPEAAIAGVDQLTKANSRFEKAGTVRTAGSKAGGGAPAASSPASGETIPAAAAAQLQEGVQHTFGNGQIWTKTNGKPVRVK